MEGVSSLTEWQPGRYERVIGFKCVIGNLMKLCTEVFVRAVHEAKDERDGDEVFEFTVCILIGPSHLNQPL